MERERGSKVIAIIALCVGIVGLSLGFAAFSSNLVIQPSATVQPNAGEFSVVFTSAPAGTITSDSGVSVEGVLAPAPSIDEETVTNIAGEEATASAIKNLRATFTQPGQKVKYTFVVTNTGKYPAYLNGISFATLTNVLDPEHSPSFKVCTAGTNTTPDYVKSACGDIELTISVAGTNYPLTTNNDIDSVAALAAGATTNVEVTIEYKKTDANVLVDGDFSVAFGDINIEYGSVD